MIRSIKWRQLFNIRQLSLLPSSSRRLSSFAKHAEKYETISVSVDEEGVAKILMNRPDKMNAMNWRMWKELKESFEVVNIYPLISLSLLIIFVVLVRSFYFPICFKCDIINLYPPSLGSYRLALLHTMPFVRTMKDIAKVMPKRYRMF